MNSWWLPRWHSGKESACQCRRCKRLGFNPWGGKIPWSRKWQPTPVFLPRKFQGQNILAGYRPWGHKESDPTEHTHLFIFCFVKIMHFKVKLRNAAPKLEKSNPRNSNDNDQVRWYIRREACYLELQPLEQNDQLMKSGCQGAMNSVIPRPSSCLPAAVCFRIEKWWTYAHSPLHTGKYEIFTGITAGPLCLSLEFQFIGKDPMDLENTCGPPSIDRGIIPCQWLICSLALPPWIENPSTARNVGLIILTIHTPGSCLCP